MTRSIYDVLVESAAFILLLVYPTLMLLIFGGMNGSLIFMLLLATIVWLKRPTSISKVVWQKDWTLYAWAMTSMVLAIFVSQTFNQSYSIPEYDAPSRYWLSIPVFFLYVRMAPNVLSSIQIALPIAAISGFVMANNNEIRSGIDTLDLIHFGDFELILGVMSLISIHWFGRDGVPLLLLKTGGFITGIAASIASGTRGGWLAIPIFLLLYLYFKKSKLSISTLGIALLALGLSATALLYSSSTFNQRIGEMIVDLKEISNIDVYSSGGMRWQIYKAAAEVFLHQPAVGVGSKGLVLELKRMNENGSISALAAEVGGAEVHNELLAAAAKYGIVGLVSIISIYAVPFSMFMRATRKENRQIRKAGELGVMFVIGFVIFGLTANILNLTMATAFYSVTVAVLLAACYNVHYEENAKRIEETMKATDA